MERRRVLGIFLTSPASPRVREKACSPAWVMRKVCSPGNDHEGVVLKVLLGFELEVRNKKVLNIDSLFSPVVCWEKDGSRIMTSWIPGQSLDPDKQTSIAGLPAGRSVASASTEEAV